METTGICPSCGKPVAASAPKGVCPECLMKAGFATGTEAGTGGPGESRFVAPSVEEVRKLFPHLEIIEMIGRGGMGAVYKARQKELDRVVALKILPPGVGGDPAFCDRFVHEAKALAKLNHPNIVTLHEFDHSDGLFYFIMEFVDGVNLRQSLNAGRLAPREALAIVPQICDALQYAHDHGIVHRDIKPENILLDRKGRVKVADFGVARLMGIEGEVPAAESSQAGSASVSLTEAGKVMGTPQYMAPEQKERPTEVDHRADIYSLGVVFYQMLTGELPGKRIEAPSRRFHLDVRLDEVVLRALEEQPERRFQQASQFKTQVETIAGGAPPTPPARSQFAYFREDVFPGCSSSPGFKNRYIRFWEKLFGNVTSSGAIIGFHISLVGFVGFLALLGIIPGVRWCLPALGFFPMFGAIGMAYISEAAARSGADLSQTGGLGDPHSQRGRWRRRIFWLVIFGIALPIFLFAVSLIALGMRDGEKALEAATALQMALIFAKAIGIALGVSLIIWVWRRLFRKKSGEGPDSWPRHVEGLVALSLFWPLLAIAASVVIWEFALTAPVEHLRANVDWERDISSLVGNGISEILVWAIIIWLICGAPGVGRFLKAVAKCAPQKEDRSMQGTSASPKVFAWLALGLFLVGLLGTILLLVFSRNDALPLIFGGTALVLALVFGAIGWRERLGRGIVVSTLIVFVISGIVVGLLSGVIPNPIREKRRAQASAELNAQIARRLEALPHERQGSETTFPPAPAPPHDSEALPREPQASEPAAIQSVVVTDKAAVVRQRQYNGEGLLFQFGDVTNRWEPKHLDSLFVVALESHLFGLFAHGADWVISSAHGPMGYNLDTPAGLVKGHIIFHRGIRRPEADGAYVIAEFRTDSGAAIPIAVKLVRDKSAESSTNIPPTNQPSNSQPAPPARPPGVNAYEQPGSSTRTFALRHMLASDMAEELRSVLLGKPGTEAKPSEDNLSLTVGAPPDVLTRAATFIAIQDWPQKVSRGANCVYRRDTVENAARSFFYACSTEDIPCVSTLLSPAVLAELKGTNWDPFAILQGKTDTKLIAELRGNWKGKDAALRKFVAAWNKYPLRQLRAESKVAMGFGVRYFATASFEGAPEEFTELSFIHDGNGNQTNALVVDTLPPWLAPKEKR
jgi:serine/threonine protein kinase/FtsH-binding integral membrane protein